jgi:hypothetical protein
MSNTVPTHASNIRDGYVAALTAMTTANGRSATKVGRAIAALVPEPGAVTIWLSGAGITDFDPASESLLPQTSFAFLTYKFEVHVAFYIGDEPERTEDLYDDFMPTIATTLMAHTRAGVNPGDEDPATNTVVLRAWPADATTDEVENVETGTRWKHIVFDVRVKVQVVYTQTAY